MAARSKILLGSYRIALFWIILTALRLGAQDLDQAHVMPPALSEVKANSFAATQSPVIRKNVDLVLVPVTITDRQAHVITGLNKQNFKLYENKKEQEIRHFSSEDAPVSIGIILDISGSMKSKIERATDAVREFCKAANPQDEFFMITFSDRPSMTGGFTSDIQTVARPLYYVDPHGRTALLDAIYLGLENMRHAKYSRRALLIISDGGDNHSRYTEHEVISQVKESDVAVYAIGIYDHTFPSEEEALGPALLAAVADVSGGRAFSIDDPDDLPVVATQIGEELRSQYLLGYRPKNTGRDGKWHKIRIRLQLPNGLALLLVRARTGYYAPKD